MKFRFKVLIINIILLSVGIATVGYFMIRKNFELALNSQIKTAIEENNLFQSSIEYALISRLSNTNADLNAEIINSAESVVLAYSATSQSLEFVVYDNNLLYQSEVPSFSSLAAIEDYPPDLISNAKIGEKYYCITENNGNHFIFVTSCSVLYEKNIHIINCRDISEAYTLMEEQQKYFSFLLVLILALCSAFMLIISYLLTRPLEALNQTAKQFGEGNYSLRSKVCSNDEIGDLANTYNQMAKSVEDHVEELNAMLEQKDQFVADFTHEIKTPMTSIIGYADTLRSREIPRESQILAASYIFTEGKRLETMSQKLFDLIYTKNHNIEKKEFPISHLFNMVKQSEEPLLSEKNIQLHIISKKEAMLLGDFELLKSAFINLVDNARKASPEHSIIELRSTILPEGDDYRYSISVSDHGIGIPKEHLSKICDEFYMVDKSRSRKEGGAGLGLSLAKLIFDCHNAKFNIESTENVGTTITVYFP